MDFELIILYRVVQELRKLVYGQKTTGQGSKHNIYWSCNHNDAVERLQQ